MSMRLSRLSSSCLTAALSLFGACPVGSLAVAATPTVVVVEGLGSVRSAPGGISCPSDCTEKFSSGSVVELVAIPDDGYAFVGWDGNCYGSDRTCLVTIDSRTKVYARFTSQAANSYPIPLAGTGLTACYDQAGVAIDCAGTGQDAEAHPGIPMPNPRFSVNGNGTVTDFLTGLVWLQRADCYYNPGGVPELPSWSEALTLAAQLGHGKCGLSDGSSAGDWRLPTIVELFSLYSFKHGGGVNPVTGDYAPKLSNAAGTGPWQQGDPWITQFLPGLWPSNYHWSSTTYPAFSNEAFFVSFIGLGGLGSGNAGKTYRYNFWAVKK